MLMNPLGVLVIGGPGDGGTAGPPGGGAVAQARFAIADVQEDFVLPSNPTNGICLFSLNGVLQHEYVCSGNTVSISPPAEAGDDVMITWWCYA